MKSSAFARSIELAKLAAKVGIKEFRSGDFKSRLEQATLIVNSLSNLKGAAMKAGQLLSLDLETYFPPEAIKILSQLQSSAKALPYSQIEEILRRELGDSMFLKVTGIEITPIGVASIGQVHRAHYEDNDIVLKVQYPGVADSIESDLKILKILASSFCTLTGRRMDLEPLFHEFKNILEQEVNYTKEAQYQFQYGSHAAKLKSKNGIFVKTPTVIEELSTEKVIAMSFEQGMGLRQWINGNPSKARREQLAITILDIYFHEFFQWGLVQTDPNFANFLVNETYGNVELILLDFGATRTYSRQFILNYIRLLHLAAEGKSDLLKSHAIKFGLIDSRESDSAFNAFEETLKTALRPFFPHTTGNSVFDFSDQQHAVNSQKSTKALAQELVYSPPPYNLVFLHRKLAGVYSILKSFGVSLDVSGYWQQMKELSKQNS
ncbi:MAG: AarF/ABC1/UbiB kinase family protein [Bdellovibrionales bacterium]|nr:AarF/ABC1/UbiB kinase family protein [Bdellovibrionales bacterium]